MTEIVGNLVDHYLYFEEIEEHRDTYIVKYQPPIADNKFATLNLVLLEPLPWKKVMDLLKGEVRYWLERYPVPLMASVFDDEEQILYSPEGEDHFLVAWRDTTNAEIVLSWKIDDLTAHLHAAPHQSNWRTVYTDVPVRTDNEMKRAASQAASYRARQARLLRTVLTLWLAVIPAGYAIFEFFGPVWLAWVGLGFVIFKACQTGLRIWGLSKPSAREEEKAETEARVRHYFYHCERNPDGFQRLKHENYVVDARERVRMEAEELADRKELRG